MKETTDRGIALAYVTDDRSLELAAPRVEAGEAGGRTLIAPMLRPIDLTKTHGKKITLRHLKEMVDAYDPVGIEAATLNFDHTKGGPAHGEATKIWLEGETLMGRWENLSPEAVEGVSSGRWKRRSAEIVFSHPATGGWYLTGLALLGATAPAVFGLPPALLLARRVHRIDLTKELPMELDPHPEATDTAPAAPPEDNVLPPTAELEMAVAAQPITFSTDDQGTPAGEVTTTLDLSAEREALASRTAELEAERAALATAREEVARETEAARRERIALEVDRDLAKLTGLPPAALRTGLRGALVELRLDGSPRRVQLSAAEGGGEKTVVEILLAALATLPPIGVLESGQLASSASDPATASGDHRTADERELHLKAGLSDTRYLEIASKYRFSTVN